MAALLADAPSADAATHLRDPTLEELYAGPTRALPSEIQQLGQEDTACTFCGVSYFVFAEVQALQTTAKKYRKTFHDFVRFLERERRVTHDLREEVATLKRKFVQLGGDCALALQQLKAETQQIRSEHQRDLERLKLAQTGAREASAALQQLEYDARAAAEDGQAFRALTEQKMRNEILHLSSQIEKCKLDSSLQFAQLTAELEKARVSIREKEAQLNEKQASWSTTERLALSERDQLKQTVLAMTERVDAERETARQLETQLSAIKGELARVVAANAAERSASAQLNSELIQLRHQLQNAEKSASTVASERTRLEESRAQQQEELQALRRLVEERASQLFAATQNGDRVKEEYVRELEKLRKEHGDSISALQRDHVRAIEELKRSQSEYLELLKRETAAQRAHDESASRETVSTIEQQMTTERERTKRSEDRAGQLVRELEIEKLQSAKSRQSSEQQARSFESEKIGLQAEIQRLSSDLEAERTRSRQALEKERREFAQERSALDNQIQELQKRVQSLESELENSPQIPQSAWQETSGSGESKRSRNNNQKADAAEDTVEKLRRALEQKDKEIMLLQQTVHRECLERTTLLERLRSGKVLPDMSALPGACSSEASFVHRSSVHPSTTGRDSEADGEEHAPGTKPKASFYEKLRGRKKSKSRK